MVPVHQWSTAETSPTVRAVSVVDAPPGAVMDSMALSVLIGAQQEAASAGGSLIVRNPGGSVN